MTKYPIILAVLVGIAAWLLFVLLLPWFTYARAYLFIGGVILLAASLTLYLAWRVRGANEVLNSARSRYLLIQGIGLFGIGIVWLLVTRYCLLHR